ncbi:hypothetical protein D3C78_1671790 [compost metagenome]
MPMARYMMPSSSTITWIDGLFGVAWTLARMSAEVPGTITTFTPLACSNLGRMLSLNNRSMVPPFMPRYNVGWAMAGRQANRPGTVQNRASKRCLCVMTGFPCGGGWAENG